MYKLRNIKYASNTYITLILTVLNVTINKDFS